MLIVEVLSLLALAIKTPTLPTETVAAMVSNFNLETSLVLIFNALIAFKSESLTVISLLPCKLAFVTVTFISTPLILPW